MERVLDAQEDEVAAGRTGVAEDAAFHAALAASAHNRAITRVVNALMDLLRQSREEALQTPGRATRSHQDHRKILQAVKDRDEVAAHRAVLDHLMAVERLVTGMDEASARARVAALAHRKRRRGRG
jgi:GntR family transcriptional repressor for pyruvate dehydrogenase complex